MTVDLRDMDSLRAGLAELDECEVGDALGLVLLRWAEVGDRPLTSMMRNLADLMESGADPDDLEIYTRADGGVVCPLCEKTFREHPREDYGDLSLHRICGGGLVKL